MQTDFSQPGSGSGGGGSPSASSSATSGIQFGANGGYDADGKLSPVAIIGIVAAVIVGLVVLVIARK
jgi:hypothetical protein